MMHLDNNFILMYKKIQINTNSLYFFNIFRFVCAISPNSILGIVLNEHKRKGCPEGQPRFFRSFIKYQIRCDRPVYASKMGETA